uniref:Uncharacterized protein n=1 Tax=Physcomitrium patens TaxID=3218 RepID=A0A2K1J7F4_PHYPA|nr:hypothetical protein PHYPA_020569 [Physcomitrium patens]
MCALTGLVARCHKTHKHGQVEDNLPKVSHKAMNQTWGRRTSRADGNQQNPQEKSERIRCSHTHTHRWLNFELLT